MTRLTIEDEALLRACFQASASFFVRLETWLAALEGGEAPTPEQLALVRGASSVLRTQHEEVATLLQKLVN